MLNLKHIYACTFLAIASLSIEGCSSDAAANMESAPSLVQALFSSNSIINGYQKAKASAGFSGVVKNFSNITWASLAKAKPQRAVTIDGFNLSSLGTAAGAATDAFAGLAAQDRTLGKTFAAAGWQENMQITLGDLQGAVKVLKGAADRTEPFNKKEQLLVAKLLMASLATSAATKSKAGLALASAKTSDGGDGWTKVSTPDFGDGLLCLGSLGFFCNKHGSKTVRTSSISCGSKQGLGLWGWTADGCPDANTGKGKTTANASGSGANGKLPTGVKAGTASSSKGNTTTANKSSGYDANGYNTDGYNTDGYNTSGYNSQGYNSLGCNSQGYLASGDSCHPGE